VSALFLGFAPSIHFFPIVAVAGASSSSSSVSAAAAAGEGSILYPTTKTKSSLLATTTATTQRPTTTNEQQKMVVTTRSSKTKQLLDQSSSSSSSSVQQSAAAPFSPRGGGTTTVINSAPSSSSSSNNNNSIINILFPIQSHELLKFLLIGTIKFFIVLALTLTRDGKDTLVVADCGAESIAFLKIYGVLPAATVFIAVYTKLASITTQHDDRPDNKQVLFYITCVPFFIFFYIFDRIIYPHRELIEPKFETVTSLLELSLGRGRHYNYNDNDNGDNIGGYNDGGGGGAMIIVAKLITHWTSALYYIIAICQ
jgi:AAA family ATP:ADP antiporter